MLDGLDLFSGIGGLTVALGPWVKPLAYCENDKFAQGVLLSRMGHGRIPIAPIWDDIRTLGSRDLDLSVEIISAGFPCQDISVAGAGAGLGGERSRLAFEVFRLAREIKPAFVFLENVPAIRTRGGERVGKELAEIGYDCRWGMLSAHDMGAPHLRERWFLLAHADSERIRDRRKRNKEGQAEADYQFEYNGTPQPVADPKSFGGRSRENKTGQKIASEYFVGADGWKTEPRICRVVDGFPGRVDRVRCLGNAVVPVQAREAFQRLMGLT